jgi:putative flippase GtrA
LKKSYLIVGVLNTCFSVTLFYLVLQILQSVQYQLILFICFVIANLQSHCTQRALVWKSTNPYFSELMRFFAGAIGIFVVNLVLLTLLVEMLGYATFESQVSLNLLLTILNYFFQKHAVFKAP